MFAAQNRVYIQVVGGNMLQIKRQKGFAMSIRLRAVHTLRSWWSTKGMGHRRERQGLERG
jgi:hypothetical protein